MVIKDYINVDNRAFNISFLASLLTIGILTFIDFLRDLAKILDKAIYTSNWNFLTLPITQSSLFPLISEIFVLIVIAIFILIQSRHYKEKQRFRK